MDASSVPVTAFAESLSKLVDATAWMPKLSWLTLGRRAWPLGMQARLKTILFSLQRGYQYGAIDRVFNVSAKLCSALAAECQTPELTALICTSPYWAALAEQWPGPVIYYSLDYTYAYDGSSPRRILECDKRLCRKAAQVFAVSRKISEYLITRADCEPAKITVLPNATLSRNVQPSAADGNRAERTNELKNVRGPIAGVIGNMADNVDWLLVKDCIERTPWLYWIFIGPYDARLSDRQQSRARTEVARHPQARFLGARPYHQLQQYARSLDVAVMPYRRKEPTYSGSATRFYEHLAAARPMFATRNVAELQQKEPLLRLFDSALELAEQLAQLRETDFCDGWEKARILASRSETWDVRAKLMLERISQAYQKNESTLAASH